MRRDIELWKKVAADAALLERAAAVDPSDVSAVAKLRRSVSADEAGVALELCAARLKAQRKFGGRAATLIADVQGVEQASSMRVAHYKTQRLVGMLGRETAVHDLCCGIGSDTIALCDAGYQPTAYDRDPLRAWMTEHNTAGRAVVSIVDVADLSVSGGVLHIDPARRDEGSGRRAWRLDDLQPGPQEIGRHIASASAAGVKLGPGIDLEAIPWPGEVEFISEAGRLVQAMLWTGALAGCDRRATMIAADDVVHTLHGSPGPIPLGSAQRYLYTFDPSVERAGLIHLLSRQADARAIHSRLGLLTSEHIINSPWLTGFELIERLPWRPRRVKQWLSSNDGGLVEVKTRGKACNPDIEQRRLRGEGASAYTVFVLRFDTKVEALVTKRL